MRRVKVRLLLVLHRPGLHLRVFRRLVLRRRLVHRLLILRRLLLRRVVALRKGVAAVAVVVLRVVDLRGEVARHAVVVVRRVGVVLVVDEVCDGASCYQIGCEATERQDHQRNSSSFVRIHREGGVS